VLETVGWDITSWRVRNSRLRWSLLSLEYKSASLLAGAEDEVGGFMKNVFFSSGSVGSWTETSPAISTSPIFRWSKVVGGWVSW